MQNPQLFMITKIVFYIQQQQQQQHSKHTLQQVVLTSIELKQQFAGLEDQSTTIWIKEA
jgi:hypothetical protein